MSTLRSPAVRFLDLFRARCPDCRRKALSTCSAYHWSGCNADGEPTGGLRSYMRCLACGGRWVKELPTPYEKCSDEEWASASGPTRCRLRARATDTIAP